jgi:hypothetical protein
MHPRSHEWARLIRKLRWIGLDDEAHRLELAVSTVPAEERGSVVGRAVQHRLAQLLKRIEPPARELGS